MKRERTAEEQAAWTTYMVRCADGTLYTGITRDVERRILEHNQGVATASRYTRSRRPVELVYQEPAATRGAAAARERAIKRLSRDQKKALIRRRDKVR